MSNEDRLKRITHWLTDLAKYGFSQKNIAREIPCSETTVSKTIHAERLSVSDGLFKKVEEAHVRMTARIRIVGTDIAQGKSFTPEQAKRLERDIWFGLQRSLGGDPIELKFPEGISAVLALLTIGRTEAFLAVIDPHAPANRLLRFAHELEELTEKLRRRAGYEPPTTSREPGF